MTVNRIIFFLGSTAPFMGSPRHPGQFRLRDNLRAITQFGRPHQPDCHLTPVSATLAPIFIPMGGRHPTRLFCFVLRANLDEQSHFNL